MSTQTAYPVIDLAETGRRIERQRREAGLTVRDLQTYFGFEYPQAIYKWQHGECLPTVDNLLALARLLRVSMEDLLVYEDQGVSHFFRRVLIRAVSGGIRKRACFRIRATAPADGGKKHRCLRKQREKQAGSLKKQLSIPACL